MAKNNRTVQHRTSERSKTKEIAELKKENHNLRRRVAKLQKYLQKALENSMGPPEPADTDKPETMGGSDITACPQCGATGLVQVVLPHGILRGCKNCGWKKKV